MSHDGSSVVKGVLAQSFDESHQVFVYHLVDEAVCYGRDIDWGPTLGALSLRSAGFLVMGGPIFGSKMMDYHRETVDFEAILR